jgi:hypothetical protein
MDLFLHFSIASNIADSEPTSSGSPPIDAETGGGSGNGNCIIA